MRVKIDAAVFFQLWKDKEKSMGEPLKLADAAQITALAPETIGKIREGKTTRYDAQVIAKLCQLLDVPPGPVPSIVYEAGSATSAQSMAAEGADAVLYEPEPETVSKLGCRLIAIRARALAEGMKTLTREEIEHELAERRGERN
jgi:DNA-binding Xre family transcriptional regulator